MTGYSALTCSGHERAVPATGSPQEVPGKYSDFSHHIDHCAAARSSVNGANKITDSPATAGYQCESTCEQYENTYPDSYGHIDDSSASKFVFRQDEDGDTLLHSAILVLNEQIAESCINAAQTHHSLNIKNRLSQAPLHLAVLTDQPRTARRLVVGGADIMSSDREGNTALHIACREGYLEIVRALLEPVRYPETKLNGYDIPYQRIPQDFSRKNYDGFSCLHLAASNGHLDVVKMLLDNHSDINVKDVKSGRTPLHHACADGDLALVRHLLTYKTCNINARSYNDLTPFDLARDRGHARITFELASKGAMAADEIDMCDL